MTHHSHFLFLILKLKLKLKKIKNLYWNQKLFYNKNKYVSFHKIVISLDIRKNIRKYIKILLTTNYHSKNIKLHKICYFRIRFLKNT